VHVDVADPKRVTILLAVLMGGMVALSAGSSPPLVPLSSVAAFDEGSIVEVEGIIVDIWVRDDGSEALVLGDAASGAVLKAICYPGTAPQPSMYATIGDLLRVRGEVAFAGDQPRLITSSDDVSLEEESEEILDPNVIAASWQVLEGDRISVSGILSCSPSGAYRLWDDKRTSSLMLDGDLGVLVRFAEQRVVVSGVLSLDGSTLSLVLSVDTVVAGG